MAALSAITGGKVKTYLEWRIVGTPSLRRAESTNGSGGAAGQVSWVQLGRERPGDAAESSARYRGRGSEGGLRQAEDRE